MYKHKERFLLNKPNIVYNRTQYSGVMYSTLHTIVLSVEYNYIKTYFHGLFPCLCTFCCRN